MLKRISIVISFCFLSMLIHSINVYCQSGNISGTVSDDLGNPIQNAEVFVYGSDIKDMSDPAGNFYLNGITSGSPRYIVCGVKNGYITAMQGEIDVPEGVTATVNLTLQEKNINNSHRSQFFELKMGYLIDHSIVTSELLPLCENAILDTLLYPESVKEYMRVGEHIDPTDPVIASLANDILMSVPDSLRTHQTEVARRVYTWVVTHIHYDLMTNYPDDLTCGNWQTVNGGWGHNFNDWCYEPQNVVEEERAICIEFERLASALLRALNIPARPAPLKAHPVTQWWVQPPDSTGYWANMETSGGSGEYWANGDSLAKFPSRQEHEIAFWWHNADAPIQNNWDSGYNLLWQETGSSTRLERSASGLSAAQTMLAEFEQYGRFISPGPRPIPDQPNYEIYIKGSNMDLSTMEAGQEITYWFPIFQKTIYNEVLETMVWTSHPEWVTAQWVETLSDPISGESIDLQYISFSLKPLNELSDSLLNAGFEEGSDDPFHWTELIIPPGSAALESSPIFHSGENSAHITGNQQQTIASYRQTLSITPGAHVRINGWIKTQNLNRNATLEIIFSGNGLINPPPFPQVKPNISGTQGWTWVNGGATAPLGAERVTIGCTLFGQGEAWFDDIQLTIWNPDLEDTSSIPFEDSRFGIFGAYALEYSWFVQQMGFDEKNYWNWVDGHFENLAAHWTRSNTQLIWELIEPELDGNYNWDIKTNPDGVITNVYDSPAGVNMLGCIHVGEGPDGFRNPLEHPTEWQNFLKAVVERYNGDGDNDLNEFVRLKYWQIGNEIFPLTNADISPEQYAQIVLISEQAIRTVDLAAKICLIAPTQGFSIDTFLQQTIIDLSNLQVQFDVIDIHHWGKAANYKMMAVPGYRTLLDNYGYNNVEIWSCEHGTWCYQPDNEPFQTKEEQSASLIKRYLWNFANGLDKLFWNNLMEWHGFKNNPGSIFNSQGLIGDGAFCSEPTEELNHLRKSYFCYKKLAENIDFDKAELVGENSFHDELNGNYGYTFKDLKTNENFYFVWTESESAIYSFSINSEYEWINLIPVNDNGDFETQLLSAGNFEITIVSGTVFLLKKRTITSVIEKSQIATEYELCQNYPNPFNPQTTISYQLPVYSKVTLKIYDILGKEVRTLVNENKSAGYHSVMWDGRDNSGRQVTSGIYFYKLMSDYGISITKKLLLLK